MWLKEYNEEFKPEEYVYKLVDLDRNGSPELLIMKEKVKPTMPTIQMGLSDTMRNTRADLVLRRFIIN